ncbi:THAP domain-containing 11 [Solea senegalensis]|uniref:THAP domain-containing 11 n=1 Tax=Solea senegalensis TaxID=28829 RepID=A0AAV6S479_SOLSE|nr:uncharacterized protein LOC122783361 isoform X2 [Solea senegalensis]KAG7511425.1 THAP domain-containing 11 [Solea senegalensis]
MVDSCCAPGCRNRREQGNGKAFYRIPKDPERRQRWITAIKRARMSEHWEPSANGFRLCSDHFISGKKSENPRSPDYVPSIFKNVPTPEKKRKGMQLDEFDRGQKSKLQRCERVSSPQDRSLESSLQPTAENDTEAPAEESTYKELKEDFQPIPTDNDELATPLCSSETCRKYVKYLELKYQAIESENLLLKEKISSTGLNETGLQNYDKKINILTGLPTYSLLMTVFNVVAPFLQQSNHFRLTIFQQFMLTLIKLKMNLSFDFLAYYFGVDSSAVSEVFKHCISVMYCRLVPCLVIWPERESLRKSLPCAFSNSSFEMTVCIIDCFEICIEKPSDLLASTQCFSTCNTIKYLIAICPRGSICFISNGWGGRTSDKFITQQSNFLSHLLPGDLVLSDRDLDDEDHSLDSPEAEITIPVYTLGNNQLDPVKLENTECLESLRTHIEKVFGVLQQKYPILQSTMPIGLTDVDQENDVTYLDKVVKVCCALTNVSESLVHLPEQNYGSSI